MNGPISRLVPGLDCEARHRTLIPGCSNGPAVLTRYWAQGLGAFPLLVMHGSGPY
jgi:hypothetical protein